MRIWIPWKRFIRNTEKMIYGFLLTRTQDPPGRGTDSGDFYQAVKHIGRYKGESGISTWLCAIAKNLWRDYLRRQKHHVPLEEADQVSVESAESKALCSWDNVQILSLIHSLEDPMREVMYLRLVGNLTLGRLEKSWGAARTGQEQPITAGKRESLRRQEKYELQDTM